MIILGISAYYHDSAASIIVDGELIAAAQEERFSRIKNDDSFPIESVRFCLQYSGYSINDIDAVSFYDKPLLKFERLLETYYAFAPRGLKSFLTAMPVWLKEKLFLKSNIRKALNAIEKVNWKKVKLLFTEHHLSHAASAFYVSSFDRAAILTVDGVGEWSTASICLGENNNITVLKEIHFPHSLGLLYSAFTYYCGFSVNSGEYKLMGLAPYGINDNGEIDRLVELIKYNIIDIRDDGSFLLNQDYFNYATGLRMVNHKKWKQLFGISKRETDSPIGQQYADLALAIQKVTEEIVFKLASEAQKLTGAEYLCVAGGVGLNGVAFGKLDSTDLFQKIFIQPAAGDAGGAIGAAYAAHHIYHEAVRVVEQEADKIKGCYLGPEYSDMDIISVARKYKTPYEEYKDEGTLLKTVAQYISEGKVIGWFQGRMEFGPRALGSRSILADARDPEMQKKLNMAIKFRESFRPFAPIVPVEEVSIYFDHHGPSPYMMFVKPVKEAWKTELSSITHVDGTARLQTVDKKNNSRLWKLLYEFKTITNCSVIINTSFNVKDEPIVNSPEDAYNCFINTGMDYLVAGNIIFSKKFK